MADTITLPGFPNTSPSDTLPSFLKSRRPTVNDDKSKFYPATFQWVYKNNEETEIYISLDDAVGQANWLKIFPAGDSAWISGDIKSTSNPEAPDGWLYCDGASISKEDNQELYLIIGDNFTEFPNEDFFNIPDYRNMILKGKDDARNISELENSQVGEHTHNGSITDSSTNVTAVAISNKTNLSVSVSSDAHNHTATTSTDTHSHSATTSTDTHSHSFRADPGNNLGSGGGQYIGNTRLGNSAGNIFYSASVQSDSHNHTLTTNNDSHNHTLTTNTDTHSHSATVNESNHSHTIAVTDPQHNHTLTIDSNSDGAENLVDNMPVYYIIKL